MISTTIAWAVSLAGKVDSDHRQLHQALSTRVQLVVMIVVVASK